MQIIFKNQFREKIENKTKVLTIRAPWKNGKGIPSVGETLYLKDGNRYIKAGNPGSLKPILIDGKNPACKGVWSVSLNVEGPMFAQSDFFVDILNHNDDFICVGQNWFRRTDPEKEAYKILKKFATMDGWKSPEQMFEFFEETYGLPFTGKLIYWG